MSCRSTVASTATRFAALCAASIALLLVAAGPATAKDTVTVRFTAAIDTVEGPEAWCMNPAPAPGDTFTGTYTYTLGKPDTAPEEWLGVYNFSSFETPPDGPNGFTVTISGVDSVANAPRGGFLVELVNDHPDDGSDQYHVSENTWQFVCPDGSSSEVAIAGWDLFDPTGTALTGTELPKKAPKLKDWRTGLISISVTGPAGASGQVFAHITSIK